MLKAALFEVVSNGENSGVESKRDDIRPGLASREQQLPQLESGRLLHVEVLSVAETSLSTLDKSRLSYYLQDIIKDPEIPQTDGEWIERLLGLGLMADDGMGNTVCPIAGLICFGNKAPPFSSSGRILGDKLL